MQQLDLSLEKAHELVSEHFNPRCTDPAGNPYPWSDEEIVHTRTAVGTCDVAFDLFDEIFRVKPSHLLRIPLDPITCSGRTRSLIPEDPITRSERSDEGGQVQWF